MKDILHELNTISRDDNSMGLLADFLINYDGNYNELRIKSICNNLNISQAVPTRLAQKIGLNGFNELKYLLGNIKIGIVTKETSRLNYNFNLYLDDLGKYIDSIFNDIDMMKFNSIIESLHKVKSIQIYSLGGIGTLLIQYTRTFKRLGFNVSLANTEEDIYISSKTKEKNVVHIFFSTSGNSECIINAFNTCLNENSKTYLFTSNENFKNNSNALLLTTLDNDSTRLTSYAMIAAITIVDMLLIELINLDKEMYLDNLEATRIIK